MLTQRMGIEPILCVCVKLQTKMQKKTHSGNGPLHMCKHGNFSVGNLFTSFANKTARCGTLTQRPREQVDSQRPAVLVSNTVN